MSIPHISSFETQIQHLGHLRNRLFAHDPSIDKGNYFNLCVALGLQLTGQPEERDYSYIYLWSGNCFKNGIGTKQDEANAIAQYKKGADLGNLQCKIRLAEFYHEDFTEESNANLFNWCFQAATQLVDEDLKLQKKYSYIYMWLGELFADAQNTDTANIWYEKGAALEDLQCAIYRVESFYDEVFHAPSPENKSDLFSWTIKVVHMLKEHPDKLEYSHLYNWLGDCCRNGIGTKVNIEAAKHWFEKGAASGNLACKINLALLYETETKENPSQENKTSYFHWCTEAVSQLEEEPQDLKVKYSFLYNWLGNCYKSGIGVALDSEMAINLFEKGAILNFFYCKKNLADLYYSKLLEIPSQKNKAEAFRWCCEAVLQLNQTPTLQVEFSRLYFWLATCFESAIGTEKNMARAIYWYEKGAELGNSRCMIRLAGYYREQIDMVPDEVIPPIMAPLPAYQEEEQQPIQVYSYPQLEVNHVLSNNRNVQLRNAFHWCLAAANQLDNEKQLRTEFPYIYWWLTQYYDAENFYEDGRNTLHDPLLAGYYGSLAIEAGYILENEQNGIEPPPEV